VFDWGLDGASWAGAPGETDFVFGQAMVGPLGLLGLLETRLGLGGHLAGGPLRACRLRGQLQGKSGFWQGSFEIDPIGTCKRLLRDRDLLCLWGWTGQGVSPRLAELHEVTAPALPGIPDRLRAVAGALLARKPVMRTVTSYTPIASLPPLWVALLQALRRSGVAVEERVLTVARAVGDLASAQFPRFRPKGDGRLCLLRRHGALDLADEAAASLAACDSLDGVVVIGADEVFAQALARHGLPRAGVNDEAPASSRLLSLVLEAAFGPMEIDDLHSLLAADPGPIPRRVAGPLIRALQRYPGRKAPEWTVELKSALTAIDEPRRTEVDRRVAELLMPVCGREEAMPVSALRARLDLLGDWARRRAKYVPSLLELVRQVQAFGEAVALTDVDALTRHELRSLQEDLGESTWSWNRAQAGLAHVAKPGAVLGPARAVIWWNFSRETAPRLERMLLTCAEREGLRALGVEPPDPSQMMAMEAESWRRPLTQAQQALVLACPLTNASGDTNHPHPFWDDLTAALEDYQDARLLERTSLVHPASARTAAVSTRPLVVAAPTVTVGSPLALREVESPSSLELLIGCSLSWALRYTAHLTSGLSDGPARLGPPLYGSIAHRVLEQVLEQQRGTPEEAAAAAGALFDEQIGDLCEALQLREYQAARATLRKTIVESARELVRLANKHGARGVRTEQPAETVARGHVIKGWVDVVWDEPNVLLDLKWGKSSNARRLETGTALQLAAYAAMRAVEGRPAETAYFSLLTQDLMSEPGGRLAEDARIKGLHQSSVTWSAALVTLQRQREALAAGQLEASGTGEDEVEPECSPTALRLPAPCEYCSFGGLCGRQGAR
jgi:ATP-dependent helicase/nuclease subunit B